MVVPDGNRHLRYIPNPQRDLPIHGVAGGDLGNGIGVGQSGNGSGNGVHGENGAFFKKSPVLECFFRRPEQFCEPVRQLGEGTQEEGEKLHRVFPG